MSLSNRIVLLICAAAATTGCVPKSRYDLAVKTAAESDRVGEQARAEATDLAAKLEAAQKDNEQKTAKLGTYEDQTYQDSRRLAELEKQLAALGTTNTEVGERLRMASKTLTELANERRTLTQAVNDTRACIDALQATRTRLQSTKPVAAPVSAKTTPAAPTPKASEAPAELVELERCVQKAVAPPPPPTGL